VSDAEEDPKGNGELEPDEDGPGALSTNETGDRSTFDPDRVGPPPAEVAELVVMCLDYVRRAVGVDLDFTPDTLPLLDHYLALARPNAKERPELFPLLARTLGAYFGEVVRLSLGGFWRLPSPNVHDWAVCARPVFLWINPVGVAYDALSQTKEHDGPRSQLQLPVEDRDAVERRLSLLPAVDDEEFVTFCTRFEVIEIAAAVLHSRMQAGGYADVEFELADYEAELNPLGSV